MPTKTDRILSYLPRTFRALPRPNALYSVADSFGNELLMAENSLAAVMMAHWVDHADRGGEVIQDLAQIAQFYGLQPRPDESVEEFREHLKRYVRIFIDGTTTVQGILRVAAESLGLPIEDDYSKMDTWWTRPTEALTITEKRGEDATRSILGVDSTVTMGQPARPARFEGRVDLSGSIDLRAASVLRLKVDSAAPVDIDLAAGPGDLAAAKLEDVTKRINAQLHGVIASHDGRHLTLNSPSVGADSRLEAQEVERDAAPRLLGLAPRRYRGEEARKAEVVGKVDLSGGVNLTGQRYLRLQVDRKSLAEVNCAGNNEAATALKEIEEAINKALGMPVASHDGRFLRLSSPTSGFGSSIALLPAAGQDVRQSLFGEIESFHVGRAALPAEVVGSNDLSSGVDLSGRSKVRVQLDNRPAVTVDCAGANAIQTLPSEIVAALAARLGDGVASHDGRFIRLSSPTVGLASLIAFESLPANEDATDLIFGISSRVFPGSAATSANLTGKVDLSQGKDLAALHRIQLSVDGGPPVEVNLRSHATNLRAVGLKELREAINGGFGSPIAAEESGRLVLTSPTIGGGSSIALNPLLRVRTRRFVTRAFISGEAAQSLFGFFTKQAEGTAATQARLVGKLDVSRGADLREARYLRASIDGGSAVDIDCAGPRPRATTIVEVVAKINQAFPKKHDTESDVASHDGQRLVLTSRTTGGQSRLAFEPPRAADALETLLGRAPETYRGRDATRVQFTGTVDLSQGIDLSQASRIKLGIDGEPLVEIDCKGSRPEQTSLQEVVIKINQELGRFVAQHDGQHVILTSLKTGKESRIQFEQPSTSDATAAIFGITPPRGYHGENAEPAAVTGVKELQGNVDLRVARFLRVAFNSGTPLDIDCAARAEKPESATLKEVVTAIKEAFVAASIPGDARDNGKNLILSTKTPGGFSRLALLPYTAGDARAKLFGEVPDVTIGTDPGPAVITGELDLLAPVSLEQRRFLRLSVDGAPAVDVDVAGAVPSATALDEVIARINTAFPGLASATEDDRLRLTSPTRGESSRLELLPLRTLDLMEYPPEATADPPSAQPGRKVNHGTAWRVINDGATESDLIIDLFTAHGVVGPEFVNQTSGQYVRVLAAVPPGGRLELRRSADGKLFGTITAKDGSQRIVAENKILTGVLGKRPAAGGPALTLSRGRSKWIFSTCVAARFDHDRFNHAHFVGAPCRSWGIFNVSRFGGALFAPTAIPPETEVEVRFRWMCYQPGAFVVHLPADLPDRFGARFNQSRFAVGSGVPEKHENVVTEPLADSDHVINRLNAKSKLVTAQLVARVPIGFSAVTAPFRQPRPLAGGQEDAKARLYLADKDVPGFIEVSAREAGAWGNAIFLAMRKVGPARFDVTVAFAGARFENARYVVLGGTELPTLLEEALRPGPLGLLHAKAAGIHARVTRDRTEIQQQP